MSLTARFREAHVGGCVDAVLEHRADGTKLLRSTEALRWYPDRLTDSLEQWAAEAPDRTFVAMRAKSAPGSDWIVEGLAEYYSLEALHRSGTVSTARFEQAHRTLADWAAREAGPLDAPRSSGATTARAVGVLRKVDAEIRAASGGRQSLDNVVADLAAQPKAVTLEMFRASTERHAGRVLASLQPAALNAPPAPP